MKVDPNKVLMEFLSFLVKGMPDAWMAHFSKTLKPVILIPLRCHFHLILSPKKSQILCLYLGAKVENSNFKCFKAFLFWIEEKNRRHFLVDTKYGIPKKCHVINLSSTVNFSKISITIFDVFFFNNWRKLWSRVLHLLNFIN